MRYIAIFDGVDTAREENEFTPLRNLFNEWYARDISKKIRAVKQSKAQRGERVNGEAPYGYIIDPDNRNHLLPDPETAHVVKQIFMMYVRGDRMYEIQDWLEANKVYTIGELRYRRTGSTRHPRPQMEAYYQWPDKTLYDILVRREYLGHTITAKSYSVSYKCKKKRMNPPEKQHIFRDTHEALVDEMTFELAQKRIATRTRPMKSDVIDLFSGLLYCGDCGYKMYLQQGVKTQTRKHAYTCGNYRNRARNDFSCTTHYIRKSVIMELVLNDLRRVLAYAQTHKAEFVRKVNEYGDAEAKRTLEAERKEQDRAAGRMKELDTLFTKLYEDKALGRLTEQQFNMLTSGYGEEQAELAARLKVLGGNINAAKERRTDTEKFLKIVEQYSDIQELNYEILHEFIDKILVYDMDRETETRKVEIFYSFVGQIDSGEKPTESTSYIRREGKRIKSIVM